jgi:lipopolysaccharide transport system permease protein
MVNPMAALIEGYHDIFYMHVRPPFIPLGVVGLLSLLLLWLSSSVFERRREEFAELV